MPRGPRLDYAGALHHLIVRGIERRRIFRTERDRQRFLDRLCTLIVKTGAALYAFALMPNHAHALIRTGHLPLSRLAQCWLGPYATTFNRIHQRCGHLFQNRFKSTLVEAEPYLLELVRYIHLNPVRSQVGVSLDDLDYSPWTGHAVLLGHAALAALDTAFILEQFGRTVGSARQAYREFVRAGAGNGSPPDLEGGGLRRSAGGWEVVSTLRRGRERWEFDERILGSSEFVSAVVTRLQENLCITPRTRIAALDALCERAARPFGVTVAEICSCSLRPDVLDARAAVGHLAVRHYGLSLTAAARHLHVSRQSIARALERAEAAFARRCCTPADFNCD